MSESLFYNRDTNISGITVPSELSGLSLTPSYGSKVEFKGLNHSYVTDSFYSNLIPLSVNSLGAKFSLKYEVSETNAQKLAAFFENQSGYLPIEFTPDNTGIYKTVSGFCDNYGVNFVNNQHFEVEASIVVDRAPTLLNWAEGNFANVPLQGWVSDASYKKYDVVYYRFNAGLTANENKLDNFYYCSGDHTSDPINSPTGAASLWSQKFFFEPDIGTQNDVKIKADVVHYENSFAQHLKTNNNIATFDMGYTYSDISDHQLKGMLHFLERKGGYRRFEHQIPSVYNRPKVYYCPTWHHTWNYYNSNTLTVDLVEDPLGVIPKEVSASPAWNTTANAYVTQVEANDGVTFTTAQKIALSIFFDALDNHRLSSKIKKMWLVGFSNDTALRDVINPTETQSWDDEPSEVSPLGRGYASYDNDAKITLKDSVRLGDLGMSISDCGAFVSCTNMALQQQDWIKNYASTSQSFQLMLRDYGGLYRGTFRARNFAYATANKQDGVFVASRNGAFANVTRIIGGRAVEEGATVEVDPPGATPNADIILWGGTAVTPTTKGNVSSLGLTQGLSQAERETLGKLVYDLCVAIGHTDLEDTT